MTFLYNVFQSNFKYGDQAKWQLLFQVQQPSFLTS